jgi:hypothetical protein
MGLLADVLARPSELVALLQYKLGASARVPPRQVRAPPLPGPPTSSPRDCPGPY